MQDATKLAAEMKGFDTSKVAVDDDQEVPTIAAGSAEEREALEAMEALLPDGPPKTASAEMKLLCLRGRKYDPARAAALMPDLINLIEELDLRSPSAQLKADLASGKVVVTGAKDEMNRAVVWLRLRFHDPKQCGPRDMGRLFATVILHALRDENTARCGIVILQDFTGVGMKNIDPKTGKYLFGECFPRLPVRIGRACIFNPPWFIGKVVLPVVKAFMSPKLKSRLVIVNGSKPAGLAAILPPTSLTEELGGSFPFDLASWAASLEPAASGDAWRVDPMAS